MFNNEMTMFTVEQQDIKISMIINNELQWNGIESTNKNMNGIFEAHLMAR